MTTTSTTTASEKIANLKAEARLLQSANFHLIAARRNPAQFGRNERRLEQIWREVDRLEAEGSRA